MAAKKKVRRPPKPTMEQRISAALKEARHIVKADDILNTRKSDLTTELEALYEAATSRATTEKSVADKLQLASSNADNFEFESVVDALEGKE